MPRFVGEVEVHRGSERPRGRRRWVFTQGGTQLRRRYLIAEARSKRPMSDAIIQVDKLGKCYRIAHRQQQHRYRALRDVIANTVAAPFGALKGRNPKSETSAQ